MRLYKALKLKKNLVGEITKLKQQIKDKNSYLEGSKNGQNFSVENLYADLLKKIGTLTSLKYIINEANGEIQSKIFLIGEYKALISFWKEVSVTEGTEVSGYSNVIKNYVVQFDEAKRNNIIADFQLKVDALQDEIDEFNFNTDIPWGGDEPIEEKL
jgi:hypothetical protein